MTTAAQATHEEEWSAHLFENTVEEQPTLLSKQWPVCLSVLAFIMFLWQGGLLHPLQLDDSCKPSAQHAVASEVSVV